MTRRKDELLTLGIGALFVRMAIPGMIGTLVTGLYNLADAVFVGQFVGAEAVGAVTLVYPVLLVNQAVLNLIGVGSASIYSRAIGRGDSRVARRIAGNLCLAASILAVLLSAAIIGPAGSIVSFIGGRGDTLRFGVRYLRLLALGFVPATLGPALNMLIRGEGRMRKAVLIAGSGAALNIVLDPIFIRVFNMGISGAAIATLVSQIVYLLLCIRYFVAAEGEITLKLKDIRFSFDLMPKVLAIGVSALCMLVLVAVQQTLLFRGLALRGAEDHVVLMGIALRVFLFAFMPLLGIGQGLQPVLGVNYGAKRFSRVKRAFTVFTLLATGAAFCVWVCLMVFPGTILRWFLNDAELSRRGTTYLRVLFSAFFLSGINITTVIFFQALGKSLQAGIVAAARQVVFFGALFWALPVFTGILGIWLVMPVADMLTLLLSVGLLIREFSRLSSSQQAAQRGAGEKRDLDAAAIVVE